MRPQRSDGLGNIGNTAGSAFAGCTALQEVVLPGDVQVIGEYAFSIALR